MLDYPFFLGGGGVCLGGGLTCLGLGLGGLFPRPGPDGFPVLLGPLGGGGFLAILGTVKNEIMLIIN